MWLIENEGAKFWLNVLTELKNRGLNDILIACVDGLKGFPNAINTVYPKARIQLCIVHMVRNSLRFVSWKDYKAVTHDLKAIYQAPTGLRKNHFSSVVPVAHATRPEYGLPGLFLVRWQQGRMRCNSFIRFIAAASSEAGTTSSPAATAVRFPSRYCFFHLNNRLD